MAADVIGKTRRNAGALRGIKLSEYQAYVVSRERDGARPRVEHGLRGEVLRFDPQGQRAI
jgi:hypothetical protein